MICIKDIKTIFAPILVIWDKNNRFSAVETQFATYLFSVSGIFPVADTGLRGQRL
jgi:hypothetical protein